MRQLKLDCGKDILREIIDLPPKHYKQVISKMLSLTLEPFPQDSKKVKGYDDFSRVDSGEYRIVYQLNDEILTIKMIGKRNDDEIYRLLTRKF